MRGVYLQTNVSLVCRGERFKGHDTLRGIHLVKTPRRVLVERQASQVNKRL